MEDRGKELLKVKMRRDEAGAANAGTLASRVTSGDVPFSERLRAPSKAYGDGPDELPDALMDGCDGGPD
jgi:hypothetical protein